MNIDIDLLKTFLEVNRTRHFGKAADNLFITQSTVSARVKLLESNLGTPVFTRSRNDIQLTPAGQKLIKFSENIITIWNQAQQEIAIVDEGKTALSIAGMSSLWDIVLQGWLNDLYARKDNINISAEVMSQESIARRLLDGTLDLGFVFEPILHSSFDSYELMKIPLILVASEDNISVEQALVGSYIHVDWGTSFAAQQANLFGDQIEPKLRTSLGRLARDFMIENSGTCYLPETMVEKDLADNVLFRVKDAPVIDRPATALIPKVSLKRELAHDLLGYFPLMKDRNHNNP